MTGEAVAERGKAERQAASVTFLHQLNEVQDGLLLAGTADGAVRVWRNYALKGEQRMATAWQVGSLHQHTCWCCGHPPVAWSPCTLLLGSDTSPNQSWAFIPACFAIVLSSTRTKAFIITIPSLGHTCWPREAPVKSS